MINYYTNCYDCIESNSFNKLQQKNNFIENIDTTFDNIFFKELKIFIEIKNIFLYFNIPEEISQKIIKMSIYTNKCEYCNNFVCKKHSKKNNKLYNSLKKNIILCDLCCWYGIV